MGQRLSLIDCLRSANTRRSYCNNLLPNIAGDKKYSVTSYGDSLKHNKLIVRKAFDEADLPDDLRALFLACAFQETTTMCASDRDASKDGDAGGAANWSLWNLNEDLIRELGYAGDCRCLNAEDSLRAVLDIMQRGVQRWGVFRYLAFVRGGRTAFEDGHSYGIHDFVNGIATMLKVLETDENLFWDDRRINVITEHV
ncbi:hypothetical protein FOA52_000384 [Chlamydomonas sp. UWO 241]|nr:hypothetical protein FOA52_000384 [Chlamydomonas sp. UWO 241]